MAEIIDAIKVTKRAQAAQRKAEAEREKINEIAKKQRVEIRKLKRLLKAAYDRIPNFVDARNDKLYEEIDDALYKDEL